MNSGPSQRVLLVEDEMLVAGMLTRMLAEMGYTVLGPATGVSEALRIIECESFEAAVLDVNLDGQMSYDVADALSARGVPFVFSTGYQKRSLRAGYNSYPMLQKPYRRVRLEETITKLLKVAKPTTLDHHEL